ncbi:MAG: hypothetical protein U0166_20905 [Acidobacteriota bacterium]
MKTRKALRISSFLLSLAAVLGTTGCGEDNPTGPSMPGSTSGTYDGTWVAVSNTLGPLWSLSFEVQDDEVVHVDAGYFLDELRCLREGTAYVTPQPPAPIVNDAFALSGTGSPSTLAITMRGTFRSASDATATVTFVYREAGNQDCDTTLTGTFAAVRS